MALGTVPKDVLDMTIIGLYPVNEQLNESIDQFLSKAASFIEDSVSVNRPYLSVRRCGSTLWMTADEERQFLEVAFDRPLNIHESLKTNPIGLRYTVTGDYLYYHYLQDGFSDSGWGCAYRSM